jgi:hypothetical protein
MGRWGKGRYSGATRSLIYVMPEKAGNRVSIPVELSSGARQRLRGMDYDKRGPMPIR